MGISARQLASDIDVSPSRISELVNGQRPITADTALRLGIFFSMEPRFWLNLQAEYDLRMVDRELRPKIASRIRVFEPHAAKRTTLEDRSGSILADDRSRTRALRDRPLFKVKSTASSRGCVPGPDGLLATRKPPITSRAGSRPLIGMD
jgi:addiction module HigA family antidote